MQVSMTNNAAVSKECNISILPHGSVPDAAGLFRQDRALAPLGLVSAAAALLVIILFLFLCHGALIIVKVVSASRTACTACATAPYRGTASRAARGFFTFTTTTTTATAAATGYRAARTVATGSLDRAKVGEDVTLR